MVSHDQTYIAKFSLYNNYKEFKQAKMVEHILDKCGAKDLKTEIYKELKSCTYCNKINDETKVSSVIYYTLRKNGIPIVFADIACFTFSAKNRILKSIFKNHPPVPITQTYYINLKQRIIDHLAQRGFKSDEVFSLPDKHRFIEVVILKLFDYRMCKVLFEKYDLEIFTSFRKLMDMCRKKKRTEKEIMESKNYF